MESKLTNKSHFVKHLQHELYVVARAQWIDNKVSSPLAREISEHFPDDGLAQGLVLRLIVGIAKGVVSFLYT